MKPLHCLFLAVTLLLGTCPAFGQEPATATATISGQIVVGVTVTAGGSGYVVPPMVTFAGGGGSGAAATAEIAGGVVTQITVTQAGTGYTNAPQVLLEGPADFATRGLVAYYPLDGNAQDQVGSNHGTTHGTPQTSDRFGKAGGAYHFDGVTSYIQMAGPLPEMTSATASLWISADSWNFPEFLFFEGDQNPGHDFSVYFTGFCTFVCKGAGQLALRNYVPPLHTWIQVVAVADAASHTRQIWIDGELRATGDFDGLANIGYHSEFSLGHRGGGLNDSFFNGAMDEVRIYNRALSAPEVGALYALQRGQTVGVALTVKSYELTLTVTPGLGYQLQSSDDLVNWTSVGGLFYPTTATVTQEVTADDHGRYWRLIESPVL